jgi:hypothetical protein
MPKFNKGDIVRYLGAAHGGWDTPYWVPGNLYTTSHVDGDLLHVSQPKAGANRLCAFELVTAAPASPPPGMINWTVPGAGPLQQAYIDAGWIDAPVRRIATDSPKVPEPLACTCPTLLNGHHNGCPLLSKKEAA